MSHTKQIIEMVDNLAKDVKHLKKLNEPWWQRLDKIVQLVVKAVEEIGQGMHGEDKKALAEEVILTLYLKHFNNKWIPDFIEVKIVKKLLQYIIDQAVDAWVSRFNKSGFFEHS